MNFNFTYTDLFNRQGMTRHLSMLAGGQFSEHNNAETLIWYIIQNGTGNLWLSFLIRDGVNNFAQNLQDYFRVNYDDFVNQITYFNAHLFPSASHKASAIIALDKTVNHKPNS